MLITNPLIRDLIKEAEHELHETIDEDLVAGKLGLRIVERATVGVRVNGYTIDNPVSQVGTELELSHVLGMVPEEILELVEDLQEKVLVDTEMAAHTFMLVNFCILRDLFSEHDSVCIIDVTGESTEVGVVSEGVLAESIHAPFGSSTLLRSMSKKLNSDDTHLFTLLRAYAEGTLSEKDTLEVASLVESYRDELSKVLTGLKARRVIPRSLAITAPNHLYDFFASEIPNVIENVTGKTHTVLQVNKQILGTEKSAQNNDIYISLASHFYHKLHGCGEM